MGAPSREVVQPESERYYHINISSRAAVCIMTLCFYSEISNQVQTMIIYIQQHDNTIQHTRLW